MLFSRKIVPEKKRWERGDFVRIRSGDTPHPLDHAGEIGVIVHQVKPATNPQSAAYGKGWYHHVWFGPWTGELADLKPQDNWRGYDDDQLEFVPTMWPYRMKEE
jgi:hypothetical protein